MNCSFCLIYTLMNLHEVVENKLSTRRDACNFCAKTIIASIYSYRSINLILIISSIRNIANAYNSQGSAVDSEQLKELLPNGLKVNPFFVTITDMLTHFDIHMMGI